jgi:hypothetical protein
MRSEHAMTAASDLKKLRRALLHLTPAQQVAAEALATGATQQAAAEAAGVTRETVTRWAGHVPAFKATLNRYRHAIATDQIETARRVRGKALAAIEAALDNGEIDPLAVLRTVVVDPSTAIGSTVPEAILDGEMNKTRANLPPTPPARGLDAELDRLNHPPPSDIERAESLTITRLAAAAGLLDAES